MKLPLCLFAISLWAAGTTPKPDAAGYPAHSATIGAEYLVHTVFAGGQSFATPDYLVFEVAIYPPKGESTVVSSGDFTLRINGAKHPIFPQPPGFVAASLKYDDWTRRPAVVGTVGMGDAAVIIGRDRRSERFPGDGTQRTRLPAPPRAPESEDRSGQGNAPSMRPEDVVSEYALPEGPSNGAVSGYLYFAYKGKVKSIRSLELIYKNKLDSVTLSLMQQ